MDPIGSWPVVRNRSFLRQPPSPAAAAGTGVHNPCPQPTSYNQRCRRVLRRLSHGPPARLRPRLHHRPAATSPSRRLDRAGSYRVFVETASGAAADWQASRRLARWCDVSRATPISMRRSSSEGETRRCLQLPEETDPMSSAQATSCGSRADMRIKPPACPVLPCEAAGPAHPDPRRQAA